MTDGHSRPERPGTNLPRVRRVTRVIGQHVGHAGLLGRSAEVGWIASRMDDVRDNGTAVVLLCGEAGIGKTSLVDALFASHAATAGAAAQRGAIGRCVAQDPDPWGALRPLYAALVGLDAAGDIGRDEAGDGGVGATAEEAHSRRFRLFARLCAQLVDALGSEPTVLAIDDIHWGQAPLHDFVRFLVGELDRSRLQHRLLLILTTRVLPPPHPVASLLADIERLPRVQRLEVGQLDGPSILRIATDAADGPASSAYLDLVERAARGNPLRAKAAVRALGQRGVPRSIGAADARTWGELRVPTSLDDPVAAWVHGLDEQLRADLGRAAVLGPEFSVGDGRAAMDDPAQLGAALRHGLLDSDGRTAWFVHSLYREVAYDALDLAERQRAHLLAAERARLAHDGGPQTALVIGRHLLAAGEAAPAAASAAAWREAGLAALSLTLWGEAARLLEAALLAEEATDPPAPADAALHCALGRAYYFDHDLDAAAPPLRRAVALAERGDGDERVWADAVVSLLRMTTASNADSWRRPADRDVGLTFLASARDPALRSRVLQILAEMQIMAGQVDESRGTAEQAIQLAELSGDAASLALAHYARAFADMTGLHVWDGIDGTRRALTHARRSGDWFVEGIMLARLSFPLLAAGELPEADAVAASCVESSAANHEHSNLALGLSVRAGAAVLRGDLDAADRLAHDADDATRRSSYLLADLFVAPALLLTQLGRGDLEAARAVADSWPNLPRSARAAYRAVVAACDPTHDAPSPETLRKPGNPTFVSAGFHLAAIDAALLAGRADLVVDHFALVDDWRTNGLEFPPSYPTSTARVLAELASAAGDHERAASLFQDAIDRCDRIGAQLELARVLAGAARASSASGGDPPTTDALGARARHIADRLGLDRALLGSLPTDGADPAAPSDDPAWRVVMMTDVVDSTAVSRRLGDVAYLDLVLRHHALVRRCLARWTGHEFSEAGDGLLAWFGAADDALRCAVAIQRELMTATGVEPRLEVRIGLAGGAPLFHDGRPYGLVLNRAARLVGHAGAGQIVVDEPLATELEPAGAVTRSEVVDLKGIGPHRVGFVAIAESMYQER